ncbi:hypothetical protein ABMA27_002453 [Loxostege sticticalis]|uniref:SRR1-like domain-containing protein n=1 Tax=Loxostege sticticalis TaxID=481309 RepID=A0ABR3HTR1_LOXSC
MSKSEVDCDGFQIVKSKNSFKKHTKLPQKESKFIKSDVSIDIEQSISRIKSAAEDLQVSEYFKDATKSVSTVVLDKPVVEIVCFGLGQISQCSISKYQLAFLLCLKDVVKPKKVLVHDPIFYKDECELLKRFDLEVIPQNSEGSYIISEHGITIVYLPHCPKQLTNNFLWANWNSNLQNCVLICNSFISLVDNNPSRILSETVPYIYKIYPFTCETVLQNNFKYTDIFNDTSIHCFPKEKLETNPTEFWVKGDKPLYNNTEEFITSLMVEKLNI